MIATLVHPGPPPARRWSIAACTATPVEVLLPVAETLAHSATRALASFDGGWLEITDATLATLDFVIPGPDPTGAHAAWYAGPHQMDGGRIAHLGLHVGRKDGGPWLHGHGTFDAPGWHGPTMGHILPLHSRLATPIRARGWGITGARLEVSADPETRFPLFQPASLGPGTNAALLTLRPNQDITQALATAASEAGIANGSVLGLGSLVHPQFTGAPRLDSFAAEILLTEGRLDNGTPRLSARVVTLAGTGYSGRLTPGANGICITAELLLVADDAATA